MKTFIILLLSLVSLPAFAQRQDPKREIYEITLKIQDELRYSNATAGELEEVQNQLYAALGILRGQSSNTSEYKCVARDNDGRAPFILIVQDQSFNIKKTGLSFTSTQTCQTSVQDIARFRGLSLICASRDGDDRSPFPISLISGADVKVLPMSMTSYQSCKNSLSRTKETREFVALCVSRDGDDRSPWLIKKLDKNTKTVSDVQLSFTSFSECVNNL
ncbi:MAG: hypothetical protein ABL958_11550 [Bdellovibrionia bacterium]